MPNSKPDSPALGNRDPKQFDLIWERFPKNINRFSSVWWYFLLIPKGKDGFGPKQMMFAFGAVAGEAFMINSTRFAGFDWHNRDEMHEQTFNTTVLGWIHDGDRLHNNIIHESCKAVLSKSGHLVAWNGSGNGKRYGGEIGRSAERSLGIQACFVGRNGGANFEVWGNSNTELEVPVETIRYENAVGISRATDWRYLSFKGSFACPSGERHLEGVGFFQRVCLNFPLFPWKWMWVAFEDGSFFTGIFPYFGLQVLNRGNKLLPPVLEKRTIQFKGQYFGTSELRLGTKDVSIRFDDTLITPRISQYTGTIEFAVKAVNRSGEQITFCAETYAQTQLRLEKPHWAGLWRSKYVYNEYLFQVRNAEVKSEKRLIDSRELGLGYGNCEYTWGLSI